MERLPKILFCTFEIPQSINAGSMQLFRAMQSYPGERIMVLGPRPEPDAELLPCRYEELDLFGYRLARSRAHEWVTGLQSLRLIPEFGLRASVRRACEFAPDVIITVMDQLSYYKHAWALSRHLRVPLVTITMDDPQIFQQTNPLLRPAYDGLLRKIYGDAALSFAISSEMCRYIEQRFAISSIQFLISPPDSIELRAPEQSLELKSPPNLTLAYAGTMSLGYREGIVSLLPALKATGTRLHVYGRSGSQVVQDSQVAYRGFLPMSELWSEIRRECDAVLLPYSYESDAARIYRTHFPSKLSEYCWTGMPIVCSGPDYATGMRWAREHPDAAIGATSPDVFAEKIRELRDNDALRMRMAKAAAQVAVTDFDPVAIRDRFRELLAQASAKRGCSHRVASSAA